MLAYQSGELGTPLVPLDTVDRIIAIGSDRMMAAVKAARHGVLAPFLKPNHIGIASINSPMQCMMKEVCAQCLQKHVDPVTGKETIIFRASTRIRSSIGWISRTLPLGSGKTRCRKNSRTSGSITCSPLTPSRVCRVVAEFAM